MYNASNLNSMKRIVYMLAVLFYGTSLFAQDKPFDIEHAPAPLFRCPIYDGPTDPTLEWNTERQEWWMFYTQRRANVPNLQEVACVYGSKVGIAATGIMSGQRTCRNPCKDRALSGLPMCSSIRTLIT